ncbi:MAG TPA: clostripain-related cysteine peptidase [Pyrinomonadaceae bacterium]|nr:clostripain-related cysteine peptidase [Pyrinomonadaceae bacterium]
MSQKEWTIMIYMAGDNNLAVDMAYAMEQIKGVAEAGTESPNLFVYYDGNSPAIPTLYCDFSEPRKPRYVRSFKVPNKLCAVPKKENENAADTRSILNFVDWCVNKVEVETDGEISFGRRAQKYALIFSGHSLGFQDIGLFKDETSGKSMKMNEFYEVLQSLVSTKQELEKDAKTFHLKGEERDIETTVLLGQKLDLLGFDSCVMGMLEVGYQFNYVAKTMIASEGSVPSAGWTYAKILGCLAREQNRNVDTRKVAELFVKEFIRSQDAYTVGGVSVDMAAWDLSQFGPLADAFDSLAEVLLACFLDPDSRVYRQMARVILQVHWQCQSYMYDQNVDLGDFCELLHRECGLVAEELGDNDVEWLQEVQTACQNVLQELKETVILSGFSGGGYQYSNGVSVFFPWSREAYEVSRKNYESLWFAKDVKRNRLSWTDFLKTYLYDVSLRKFETPLTEVPPGSKFKYFSGVRFDERSAAVVAGNGTSSTKIAGQEGSKIAGQEGTKIAGQEGSKIAGQEGSKIAGQEGSKIAGQEGSKIAGQEGSKIAGQEGSKIAGQEGSKIAGQEGSKIAGQEGSKIAGQEGSKIAGQEGSKIAGQEGSKLAGGGGGSSAFFQSLRLFKNVESRWDISGFTKKPEETDVADRPLTSNAKAGSQTP